MSPFTIKPRIAANSVPTDVRPVVCSSAGRKYFMRDLVRDLGTSSLRRRMRAPMPWKSFDRFPPGQWMTEPTRAQLTQLATKMLKNRGGILSILAKTRRFHAPLIDQGLWGPRTSSLPRRTRAPIPWKSFDRFPTGQWMPETTRAQLTQLATKDAQR
jgi:hypothetical protein